MAQNGSFEWLRQALHHSRTIKTWLRCCLVLAAALVLMVVNKTSLSMGQAAFFIVIVPIMLPPNLALSVFVLAATTLMLGMLVGWAWGCAAMASALSVRSQELLARQQQALQSSLVAGIPTALQVQQRTFEGLFLDPRSSAVYGVFFVLGIFALSVMRAFYPSLTYLSIFGTIVLDVICTTGPSLPTARYLIAKPFILPTCYYLAIAVAGIALIFPESLNHIWLATLQNEFWEPVKELLLLQTQALEARPSNHEEWENRTARGRSLRLRFLLGCDTLLSQVGLMGLDISVGRLGPADLKRLSGGLKSMMFRAGALQSFQAFVHEVNLLNRRIEEEDRRPMPSHFKLYRREVQRLEREHKHDLNSLAPILNTSSADLRLACQAGVEGILTWVQDCNDRRWSLFRDDEEVTEERIGSLQDGKAMIFKALQEFRKTRRPEILKPYERFFDPVTRKPLIPQNGSKSPFAMRSLFICFVFLDTLEAFAEGVVETLDLLLELDRERPKSRVWFPGRLGRIQSTIQSDRFGATDPLAMGTSEDPTKFKPFIAGDNSEEDLTEARPDAGYAAQDRVSEFKARIQDPDAVPLTTGAGRLAMYLGSFVRFFKSPEGIFAFRLTVVSVALWMPSIFKSTAWFYYTNKGLWALITAQTTLAIYAGDQIAGFVVRFVGTAIGLLIGMAVWYIGSGTGPGNPYGIVVATTVFLAPFMLARIACPREQQPLWIMSALTIVFVVGYSWVNANHPVLGNPGVGVTLGWKRALLVVVGFAAAFLVMLFPNPNSSRVLVRKSLAAVNSEIGDIFAREVEAFLSEYKKFFNEATKDSGIVNGRNSRETRSKAISLRVMAVAARLRIIEPSLTTAKWEPHLSGRWPYEHYQALFDLQSGTLGALVLLVTSFSKLDSRWCAMLIQKTPLLNPYFLSDLFTTISVLSGSLMSGHPLPPCLPKLRDRLLYHDIHTKNITRGVPPPSPSPEWRHSDATSSSRNLKRAGTPVPTDHEGVSYRIEGVNAGLDDITLDTLMDPMLPAYCTAVVGLLHIIGRIDDIADTVRTLCGETASMKDYNMLQQDYLNREERSARVMTPNGP